MSVDLSFFFNKKLITIFTMNNYFFAISSNSDFKSNKSLSGTNLSLSFSAENSSISNMTP